jgi:hypothetical protein
MSADVGRAETVDARSVAASPASPGLTMVGSMDEGTCADGMCALPESHPTTGLS